MTTDTPPADDPAQAGAGDQPPAAETPPSSNGEPPADPGAAGEGAGGPKGGFGKAAAGDGDAPEFGEGYLNESGEPDFAKIAERLKAADEADSARAERAGEVPESAEGYADILKSLELPDGLEGEFKPDDPLLQDFFKSAKEAGKGKAEVKAELELFTKGVASTMKQVEDARNAELDAEFAKVGAERFNAAKSALKTLGGEKAGEQYAGALDDISSAATFELLEGLIHQINGGGAASPGRGAHGADVQSVDPALRMQQLREAKLNGKRN